LILMSSAANIPSVFDTQSLSQLKGGLRKDDPQALKAAARQFEAVFLQMVLKSMRAATPQTGMMDSDQTRFYQELLDSQLAQVMSAKGGVGLAGVIERQLSRPDSVVIPDREGGIPLDPVQRSLPLAPSQRSFPLRDDKVPAALPLGNSSVQPAIAPLSSSGDGQASAFVAQVLPHAQAASQETGIPAHFLVAQAALESGWGRTEPRFADGRPSFNLFGIKAGSNWQGAVVEASTTEYVNGVAEQRVERFRAYASYAEGFQDYANLMAQSPRYAAVVGSQDAAGFARGLQRAGYATDPAYAAKLERIITGPTLRQALTG
jgi:flagellar protein FlgJ